MVQSIRHGTGKEDHTQTTYKNLPERMPNSICQSKFGFDNIEILQEYQKFLEEKKLLLLTSTIDTIKVYFENLQIKYTKFENIENLITITYSKIPKAEREAFGNIISKILDQIKDRILNLNFNRDYYNTGNMKLRFHIRNCGYYQNESLNGNDRSPSKDDKEQKDTTGSSQEHDTNLTNHNKSPPKDDKIDIREIPKQDPQDPENNRSTVNNDHILNIRKNVALPKYLLEFWNPEQIRSHLESGHKLFSSNDQNITKKTIRLTESQAEKWDIKEVRAFLRSLSNNDHPGQTNHKNMKIRILQDKIDTLQNENILFREILKQMVIPFVEKGIKIDFKTEKQAEKVNQILEMVFKND
ncbi:MAG: hypothetical protein ACFFDN_00095 [Candidatus Hodarchaeota archaeon]